MLSPFTDVGFSRCAEDGDENASTCDCRCSPISISIVTNAAAAGDVVRLMLERIQLREEWIESVNGRRVLGG